jgi:hypothetical protein
MGLVYSTLGEETVTRLKEYGTVHDSIVEAMGEQVANWPRLGLSSTIEIYLIFLSSSTKPCPDHIPLLSLRIPGRSVQTWTGRLESASRRESSRTSGPSPCEAEEGEMAVGEWGWARRSHGCGMGRTMMKLWGMLEALYSSLFI